MVKPDYIYHYGGLYVAFQRVREGPNHFDVCYKGSSRIITSVNEMKKILGSAKFLQSSKELYEWMENLLALSLPKPKVDMDVIRKEGFGPEAHQDEEPNDNTKMIV